MSPKGPPYSFPILQKKWMFENSQRPPFTSFGTMGLTGDQRKIRKKIEKKFRKEILKNSDFFQFFPHAGTVEDNT